jgi:hypothetical protein
MVVWNQSQVGVDVEVLEARTLRALWGDHARSFAIDPQGTMIAFATARAVVVRALADGEERALRTHGLADPTALFFGAEGDRIVVSGQGRAEIHPLVEGEATVSIPHAVEWASHRAAIVVLPDGSRGRWILSRGELGPRILRGGEGLSVFVHPSGVVAGARADRLELVGRDGELRSFVDHGEHAVWETWGRPDGGAVAIAGRYGAQLWSADGVREAACAGEEGAMDWSAGAVLVTPDAECDLTSGRSRPLFDGDESSADGRFVLGGGIVLDRATRMRTRLRDLPDVSCAESDESTCDPRATIAPGGTAVVVAYRHMGADTWLHVWSTATARAIGSFDASTWAFAPNGSWLAVAHGETTAIVDLGDGTERASFAVPGSSTATPVHLWPSPDADAIAWRSSSGPVHLVDARDGRETGTFDAEGATWAIWSRDGTAIAAGGERAVVVHDVAARSSRTIEISDANGRALCSRGRAMALLDSVSGSPTDRGDAARGFEEREIGSCDGWVADLSIDEAQRFAFWSAGGVVRVRRLRDGAELVLRTLRDPPGPRHFAHDAEGHWWSDGEGVPDWARGGSAPLDASMRRDDLLAAFFAPAS